MAQQVNEITKRFLETTSCRSSSIDSSYYTRIGILLTQRLGTWLPGKGQAVLDLGCGLGDLCGLAVELGASEVVGVDLCSQELDLAREQVKAEFIQADITEFLKTEKRCFDWIGCLNILEHLPKDRVIETLRLARERLKPDGVLVAMAPNALSPMCAAILYGDFTHEWAFTPNSFRQLAILCGYETPEFRECGPIPHGLISGLRFVAWKIVRLFILSYLLIELADRKDGIYTMNMMVRLRGKARNSR